MIIQTPNSFYARDYQHECVDTWWNYYAEGGRDETLAALPTGTGKSVIPPLFLMKAYRSNPYLKTLSVTHVKELVAQNEKALRRVWPTAPVGVCSAGLGRKETHTPIVLGSIQTVKNNVRQIGRVDILFIDECHLLNPNRQSMYKSVIQELRFYNPNLIILGLTATHFRMGQGLLTEATRVGEEIVEPLFKRTIFDITGIEPFNRLISECYLSPLIPKRVENMIDVSDVREMNGDFVQAELAQSIDRQNITGRALIEAADLSVRRKSIMAFGAGIANCYKIYERLNQMGISSTIVHSNRESFKMSDEERDRRIADFKEGKYRCIVSNSILTTGFDHPPVDAIFDLRPTVSTVLHIQKYGRGTRPYFHPGFSFEQLRYIEHRQTAIQLGGKQNCLVLDFAGNTQRLGPINDPVIPKPKTGQRGEVPVKICDNCGAYNHTVARYCTGCGMEFVFKTKLKASAGTADIIRTDHVTPEPDKEYEFFQVDTMDAYLHSKPGKTPKMRVQYLCGFQLFRCWLGFEQKEKGLVKHRAHEWWRQHQGDDIPQSTDEAIARFHECRKTVRLKVDVSGQYPDIAEYLFS